ncbi:chitin-binding type-2 domain-containing protein [Nephila pilipes]|uniref:Chitin-binding type-2 domain-containing protein n=1 Tax=Nephila pilipes TaxID=299642 RepID=A0A8X6TZ43_NEPPI|nr:chitin-binding type-2 domain-containing protein [Nephila pilipes]
MLLLQSLLIVFSIVWLGRCQFVYNYEEDPNGHQTNVNESPTHYDSVRTINKENEPGNKKLKNSQEESQRFGTQQSARRSISSISSEHDQEPQDTRNAQRPRRRKYRRILREGEYVQPPQPPVVYSPSVFENIKLGEAPNGVYVPQDSLLNILKNPNRGQPSSQYQVPQSYPQYSSNYQSRNFQNSEPEYKFFGQPSLNEKNSPQDLTISVAQPNVRYVSSSPVSTSSQYGDNENIHNRRPVRTNRQRNQRQRMRSGALSEPEVDIDALMTIPAVMPRDELSSPQVRQLSQPRSVSRNTGRQNMIQSYWESNQSPKVYSPSEFQNIGLGEAPRGVHIPEDSLLNVIRNPSRPQSSPENTAANQQVSSQVSSETHMTQQNSFQPPISIAPESSFNPRRQSRQRGSSRVSRRNFERRSEYPSDNDEPEPEYTNPVSNLEQRRRQISSDNSFTNQRQRVNQKQTHQSPRSKDERLQSKHSAVRAPNCISTIGIVLFTRYLSDKRTSSSFGK